ncbi:MAG: hypothetical protein R3C01_01105 [Planctomycetaceae bacterium]
MRKWTVAIVFFIGLASCSLGEEPEKRNTDAGLAILQDGTETAEEALHAFVTASRMGDVDASLLLIDPPIRKLLIPEIAIDAYLSDSLLAKLIELKNEKNKIMLGRGAIPVAFAERDLIGEQKVKVLLKRQIDDDRIVFDVETISQSYHDEGTVRTAQQYLAVRRDGRWRLFRPFGMMLVYLRSEEVGQDDASESLDDELYDTSKDQAVLGALSILRKVDSDVEGVDYKIVYHVPLEKIHEAMVEMSAKPEVNENIEMARNVNRFVSNLKRRIARGDYTTDAEIMNAFDVGEEVFVSPLINATNEIGRQNAVRIWKMRKQAQSK